ncbi:30S ribosomal protein S21 [bacterium]|nr:30S ribosomal protein S21 [bacterium]
MKVIVRNNDISKAYKILNKKLHEDGVFKQVRDNQYHKSKGEKKREAARAGRARWLKKQKQLELKFLREERNQFKKRKKPNYKKQSTYKKQPSNSKGNIKQIGIKN